MHKQNERKSSVVKMFFSGSFVGIQMMKECFWFLKHMHMPPVALVTMCRHCMDSKALNSSTSFLGFPFSPPPPRVRSCRSAAFVPLTPSPLSLSVLRSDWQATLAGGRPSAASSGLTKLAAAASDEPKAAEEPPGPRSRYPSRRLPSPRSR